MITCKVFVDGRPSDERVETSDVGDVLARDDAFLWLDSLDPTDDDLAVLQKVFDLHPLTIEDLKHRHQRPKVELYQDYAFVVLRPLELTDSGMIEKELHAFVGRRFIVTLRPSPATTCPRSCAGGSDNPSCSREGGGFAIYVLIDEVVDDYLTPVERFEDDVDDLEDTIFADGEKRRSRHVNEGDLQQQLFQAQAGVSCGSGVSRSRSVQGIDLIQEQPELVSPPLAPYYRDVMDHVIRVVELIRQHPRPARRRCWRCASRRPRTGSTRS